MEKKFRGHTKDKKYTIFRRIMELLGLLFLCLFYRCPFRLLLHIECPGCGMTRAVLALMRLDFKQAFQYHSLFPLALLCGGYYVLREYVYIGRKKEQFALVVIAVLFIIRWGIRMFGLAV